MRRRRSPGSGAEVCERYIARYVDFFGPGRLAGRRIGVYQHSAAGRDLLSATLRRLGAEVIDIGRTDRFVPIDTEAVAPEDAARLRDWVQEHRLEALVSTDGDGDRPLIADETGTTLRGDAVGALTARFLGADAVATPLSSSTAVERCGWFPTVRRTRIGSPWVIEAIVEMKRAGARLPVGYEANGGFLLGGTAVAPDGRTLPALPTRDAMTPIVALLSAMAADGRTLAELAADLPSRVTASDRVPEVPEEVSGRLLAALSADAAARRALLDGIAAPPAAVDTLDGVRMTLASGEIVHLRASGNAPELRCYTEADSRPDAERLLGEVVRRVEVLLGRVRAASAFPLTARPSAPREGGPVDIEKSVPIPTFPICATKCGAGTVSPYFHLLDKYISKIYFTRRCHAGMRTRNHPSRTFDNTLCSRANPRSLRACGGGGPTRYPDGRGRFASPLCRHSCHGIVAGLRARFPGGAAATCRSLLP